MDIVQIFLILVAFFSYLASFSLAYLNTFGNKHLYYSNNGAIDKKYFQQASPEPIAFGIIWPIIYTWNLTGILYIVVSCWLSNDKSPVKLVPTLVPKKFLLSYSMAFLATVGWLFAFDRELLILSFFLLVLAILSAYSAIGISYKVVNDNASHNKAVVWYMRALVQNGLCTFATWLTIATLLNLSYIMIYEDSFGITPAIMRGYISVKGGSSIVLVMLMAVIIGWFIVENFVFAKFCRYTHTIYPVLMHGLFWLIYKLQSLPGTRQNLILASVNFGVALMAFVARLALLKYGGNKPLASDMKRD